MRRIAIVTILSVTAIGCSEKKMFTNLGNGTGVPTESIGAYAAQHGLTRQQAKREMLIKDEERKAAEAIAQAHREDNIELGPSVTP